MRPILLLYFLLTGLQGFAQSGEKQYQFRRIDISKGLSNSQVNCILKDSDGFMWIGTMSGLNRFDGYTFKVFKHDPKDSASIDDDYISRILELPDAKLLVETRNGINIYDPFSEKFDHKAQFYFNSLSLPVSALSKTISTKSGDFYFLQPQQGLFKYSKTTRKITRVIGSADAGLYDFTRNNNGDFWLMYSDGTIKKLDGITDKICYSTDLLREEMDKQLLKYIIMCDDQDQLWIYAAGETKGVFNLRPAANQLIHIIQEQGAYRLNTNLVRGIIQGNQTDIWICTDHGGINILDKKNATIQYIVNNADDNNSLSQNSIIATYKDNEGIIWIGTYKKGINCYYESNNRFALYRHMSSKPNSLPFNDVNRFAEDGYGNIWIGTNGGGLIYFDRKKGTFRQYLHQPDNDNSVGNNVIVSLCVDKKQQLWIGTYYGGLDCFDGKSFTHYRHNPADSNSLADNKVWEIYEDSEDNLWVGTLGSGIDRFDREKKVFHHYNSTRSTVIQSNFISAITENKQGDIWIGTAYGLSVFEKSTGNSISYQYTAADSRSLSNNNIFSIYIDSKNRAWVGTREGLNLFNAETKSFQHFTVQDGLPDNAILNILEDSNKNIWISTPNGISSLTVTQLSDAQDRVSIYCKNFDEADGLQGTEFNENAALRTKAGELIFGGANGFNIFKAEKVASASAPPKIVFTDLQVFNKSVGPGELFNGKILLAEAISKTTSVTLNYHQNDLTIEFAALDFSKTEKSNYSYKLEGFKDEWTPADRKVRKAFFTNLDPGNYTFYVRTANDKGGWNDNIKKLSIKILPPFWKTTVAYVLYTLLVLASLYIGRLLIIRKAKSRFDIERERIEAQKMHELDLMKIKFFTNVSHEFRTPLSLIMAPLDKMLKLPGVETHRPQLQLIHRNARRLLNLVNQLLDFRKMEEKELKLHLKSGDIIGYISDVSHFFTDVADRKNISFSFVSDTDSLQTQFDHDKIERILFNLLSNAFKFTPENGHVGVELVTKEIAGSTDRELEIKVLDTGIGIEKHKQEKIFKRFFQNDLPGSMVNQGSGIGLAITLEFVTLHGGSITVESEPDKGSCFIIQLPVKALPVETALNSSAPDYDTSMNDPVVEAEMDASAITAPEQSTHKNLLRNKKASVLLVEDNEDFRFYLKDNLKEHFTIMEAGDGRLGWQKALAGHPDLIVSDISMPEMTGTELCKKLKADQRTKHIPVILLTALAGEDQQLKGLETGASDYMTKPFNFEILLSKIKNQLAQKEQFRKTYQKQVEVKPSDVAVESPNERFMQQLMVLIEKNMSEPDFSVEDMSREMFMSRVALYKKLLSLTGKTPIEFLRQVRIKRSALLIEKTRMTVAEVAYEVGFNNPKYFSKYFKLEYGKLPSAYIEEVRKGPLIKE